MKVVVDELPSQIIVNTCLTIEIWTQRTSMWFYAIRCHPPKMAPKVFDFTMDTLARRRAMQCTQLCAKSVKMALNPWTFYNITFILKRREYRIRSGLVGKSNHLRLIYLTLGKIPTPPIFGNS